jgi:hypothetical protein
VAFLWRPKRASVKRLAAFRNVEKQGAIRRDAGAAAGHRAVAEIERQRPVVLQT